MDWTIEDLSNLSKGVEGLDNWTSLQQNPCQKLLRLTEANGLNVWVEATTRLCVRLPDGNLVLEPGQPVNIPKEQAQLLIKKAHGKVRLWNHTRTGRIVLVTEDGWIVVQENKRAGRLVFLQLDGNVQIERGSASG